MGGLSIYSFGEDSPLKFTISDKLAKNYNEAVEEFFKAQRRFSQKFGRSWDPKSDPIRINWSRRQQTAWNAFGELMKIAIETQGPIHINDIMEDFLVKNTASAARGASKRWRRVITVAVSAGVLYGFLKR